MMAFFASLIWFVISGYLAFRMWGKLQLRGFTKLYKKAIKKQLSYGLKVYASGLMGLLGEPLIKILVANYFGPTFVGFLDIGMRIRNQLGRIIQGALWPLFQLFAEIKEKAEKARISIDVQEKTILFVLPIAILLIFGAEPLVTLWIGKNIHYTSMSVIFVGVTALVGTASFMAFYSYIGVDYPLVLLFNGTINNIVYVGFVVALQGIMGFSSVFAALVAVSIANIIFCIYYQYRFWGRSIYNSPKKLTKLFSYVAITSFVGFIIQQAIDIPIIHLVVLGITVPLISLFLYISLSLINKEDIERYLGTSIFAQGFNYLFRMNDLLMERIGISTTSPTPKSPKGDIKS
jgi:O-antigen/teichoic acid export membrane protein